MFKNRSVLFLLAFCTIVILSGTVYAGDKWNVTSVKVPKVLDLGGADWDFKVTIKNAGLFQTSGENVVIKVTMTSNGNSVVQTFHKSPAVTRAGGLQIFNLALQEATQLRPSVKGTYRLNILIDIIETGFTSNYSQNLDIEWK